MDNAGCVGAGSQKKFHLSDQRHLRERSQH